MTIPAYTPIDDGPEHMPDPADKYTFSTRMYALLVWLLESLGPKGNALASWMNTVAGLAQTAAVTATEKAAEAVAAAGTIGTAVTDAQIAASTATTKANQATAAVDTTQGLVDDLQTALAGASGWPVASINGLSGVVNFGWSHLQGKPTTLTGFGITDAMALAAGGWNAVLPAASDLRAMSVATQVFKANGAANAPAAGHLMGMHFALDADNYSQIVFGGNGNEGRVWLLQRVAGTYKPAARLTLHSEPPVEVIGGAIDCRDGNVFLLTMNSNTTLSFSNIPAAGLSYTAEVEVIHNAGTFTWPANCIAEEGMALPTLPTGKRHLLYFRKSFDSTKWYVGIKKGFAL